LVSKNITLIVKQIVVLL